MIPRSLIDGFTVTINNASAAGKAKLRKRLERMDLSDPDKAVDGVVRVMTTYAKSYANQIAVLSTRFYDDCRRAELGEALQPVPNPLYVEEATEDAARGILYKYSDDAARLDMLVERLDYEIKKAAANAVIEAGSQDTRRPRYARVPSGTETCTFCLMLASRGYVYRTPATAGEDGHYHASCDCRIVPSWSTIEGYDPRAIYDRWREATDEAATKSARAQAQREGLDWDALSSAQRSERVKKQAEADRRHLEEAAEKAKAKKRQERIDSGETIVRGTYRGVTGAGARSYLKYGMTEQEWIANGRRPYTTT